VDTLTADTLKDIMRACAGEDESVNLDADFESSTFEDLGYDSLALLETTSRVERLYGVKLPEEELSELHTPAEFLTLVNKYLHDRA
jgi:act minimal PKS acyl carrier protein